MFSPLIPSKKEHTQMFVVAMLLFIGSCTKDVGINNKLPERQGANVRAAAFTFTGSAVFDIGLTAFIPCANGGVGEDVVFSGSLHDLFHLTINGNSFTIKMHDQPQGLKGIGSITGDEYNATGVTQSTENGSFVNGSYTYTYINNFKLIGPGTGNNLLLHETYKITVNANGSVVIMLDNYSFDCK